MVFNKIDVGINHFLFTCVYVLIRNTRKLFINAIIMWSISQYNNKHNKTQYQFNINFYPATYLQGSKHTLWGNYESKLMYMFYMPVKIKKMFEKMMASPKNTSISRNNSKTLVLSLTSDPINGSVILELSRGVPLCQFQCLMSPWWSQLLHSCFVVLP